MADPLLGGISAIEVAADGLSFAALSDRGAFTTGQFTRDAKGQITAVVAAPVALLLGKGSTALQESRADSEGLAMAADGTAFVSFEGAARVLRYARLDGPAENLPSPPEFDALQDNSALEALAIDAAGTLYTLPERSGSLSNPFPVFRYRAGQWDSRLSIPRLAGFLAVGADFGPDGRFYLLERQFLGLSGFASRLRRFTLGPDGFDAGQTLLETPVGLHDNLEGVAIWRDAAGRLVATLVADDNFNPLLRNEIVEYHLPD